VAPAAVRNDAQRREVLVFSVAERLLALPAEKVEEVVRAVEVTPLPDAPVGVEGALNVRGSLLAVVDVRARCGLPTREIDVDDHLVLVRYGESRFALRVDRVVRLESVELMDGAQLRMMAPGLSALGSYGRTSDERMYLIYDLPRFLEAAEIAQLARLLNAAGEGKTA
jgi:purine-binding chemotaxis protein CheW